jgi:putative transposase
MSKNVVHARTCVYNCNYHVVFSTKYRKRVLSEEVETAFKLILSEIALDKEFIVRECEMGEKDHIHLFVSAHPKIAPAYIVKMIKGITARKLFMQFPKLKEGLWKGHLWNPSYYIETIGSISEEAIRKYIEKQSKK